MIIDPNKAQEIEKASVALDFIMPILKKYNFRWVITGGFACYAYGVDRLLTDIDIDIDTSKDSESFQWFAAELHPYITQPLENYRSESYDNYNFEVTYHDQIIDLCPMAELKIFDAKTGKFEQFYQNGFPETEQVIFNDFKLPLLAKQVIIENKEMLVGQDAWDRRDIESLKAILKVSNP